MENIRNIFMAMSKDIRVIIVKLADWLHNMRTLSIRQGKVRLKSRNTGYLCSVAHRLGMSSFRTELEDLAFMHLYPEEYADLTMKMERDKEQRFNMIDSIKGDLESDLKNSNIEGHVEGRVKHLYSIYRKMISQINLWTRFP